MVTQANAFRWIFPALAAGLLGWWWLQSRTLEPAPSEAAAAPSAIAESVAPAVRATPGADRERILPGGFNLPALESATPSEVRSLRQAEAARSAAALAPPRSYTGVDGKQHALDYERSGEVRNHELALAARRDLLMTQLKADPQGFARTHGLSAKEVQWILEGETDFPERLLD